MCLLTSTHACPLCCAYSSTNLPTPDPPVARLNAAPRTTARRSFPLQTMMHRRCGRHTRAAPAAALLSRATLYSPNQLCCAHSHAIHKHFAPSPSFLLHANLYLIYTITKSAANSTLRLRIPPAPPRPTPASPAPIVCTKHITPSFKQPDFVKLAVAHHCQLPRRPRRSAICGTAAAGWASPAAVCPCASWAGDLQPRRQVRSGTPAAPCAAPLATPACACVPP